MLDNLSASTMLLQSFAGKEQAADIFKSEERGVEICVINCFAEAFPEREPNSGRLSRTQSHLRVDFVCERSDGSAIRLHQREGPVAVDDEDYARSVQDDKMYLTQLGNVG